MKKDKYTHHWHTYSDHLNDILNEMSFDDSFADVTLVTDDKKQIKQESRDGHISFEVYIYLQQS